jgi:hypothetical protein
MDYIPWIPSEPGRRRQWIVASAVAIPCAVAVVAVAGIALHRSRAALPLDLFGAAALICVVALSALFLRIVLFAIGAISGRRR